MTSSIPHYTNSSHHFAAHTFSERLAHLRRNGLPTRASSSIYRRASHFTDDFVARIDRLDVLGGDKGWGESEERYPSGHSGCVNALAFSQYGDQLASGSDDRKVILWRTDSTHTPAASNLDAPRPHLIQSETIETGHRANIFSVKWAPNCGDRRLFTCAGDAQMRVFDLTRTAAASEYMIHGRTYKFWSSDQGVCTRVLRCHSERVKDISTENSADIFLSCAEDGQVRQTDLRTAHTCSRMSGYGQGCPRPLVQMQMELYSLSVSKLEPWLFAVSGTSDKAFLMDRRMVPRLLKREWGMTLLGETAALSHCVRFFEREGGAEASQAQRWRREEPAHITAVKISENNGRDVLANYSFGGLVKFDMKCEQGMKSSDTLATTDETRHRTNVSHSPIFASSSRDTFRSMPENMMVLRERLVYCLFSRRMACTDRLMALGEAWQIVARLEEQESPSAPDARNQVALPICKMLLCVCEALLNSISDRARAAKLTCAKRTMLLHADHPMVRLLFGKLDDHCQAWSRGRNKLTTRLQLFDESETIVRTEWTVFCRDSMTTDADELFINFSHSTVAERSALESDPMNVSEDGQAIWPVGAAVHERILQDLPWQPHYDGAAFERVQSWLAVSMETGWEQDDGAEHYLYDREADSDDYSDESMDTESIYDDEDSSDDDGLLNMASEELGESNDARSSSVPGAAEAPQVRPFQTYLGHVNSETVKDCGFAGSNDEYVWSGSDCGHLFMWRNDAAGRLCGVWKGDDSVVNEFAMHPTLPMFAVSGIDNTVKVFGPQQPNAKRTMNRTKESVEIIKRNRTKDHEAETIYPYAMRHILHQLAREGLVAPQSGSTYQFERRRIRGNRARVDAEGEEAEAEAEDCIIV